MNVPLDGAVLSCDLCDLFALQAAGRGEQPPSPATTSPKVSGGRSRQLGRAAGRGGAVGGMAARWRMAGAQSEVKLPR